MRSVFTVWRRPKIQTARPTSRTRKTDIEDSCWKKTMQTGTIAARKKTSAGSRRPSRRDAAGLGRGRRPAAARSSGKKRISVAAARSDVAPSTMKSAGHETAARKPPTAGPTLIPRFTASRWRANAALRWSGAARCETTLRLAGRNISR